MHSFINGEEKEEKIKITIRRMIGSGEGQLGLACDLKFHSYMCVLTKTHLLSGDMEAYPF